MSSLIHGYLTDERLKIRPGRLPGEVRRLLGRCGEVEVILFSRIRRICSYNLDGKFVRINVSAFYYRLLLGLYQ